MNDALLEIRDQPYLTDGRMILAFTGWMDGGNVSTGTVEWLVRALDVRRTGAILPSNFYLYNFPGSMEVAALVRPHARIEQGMVQSYTMPENTFYCSAEQRLVLFHGREPNLHWDEFAECIFTYAAQAGVSTLYFVGSFGGTVPHTREPRLWSAVSDAGIRDTLESAGLGFTDYEGPASFSTHLLAHAGDHGLRMATLVAEIPPYIHGPNPLCIEAVVRKLAGLLALPVNLDDMRLLRTAWEERLNEILTERTDLAEHIQKLEEDYDNQVFDTQMGDLKQWLEQRGIRVD
ncbi:MAG: PAC2 family protein [Phycisphaerae bacterium]|jgi:predicted ATP-grasp superfamily ATP-dependent carboligase